MRPELAAVLALAAIVACKRHEDAAPSSSVTTAPAPSVAGSVSASASAEALVPAPSASASVEVAQVDAGAPSSDAAERARERKAAIAEAAEYGMLGVLPGATLDAGSGVLPPPSYLGPTRLPGGSHPPPPSVRMGSITVNGRLPKEVVQRVVRQRFGAFRLCYEAGLRLNPSLTGRVTTRFVIGADGLVSTTQDSGSDLPDQNAVLCVVRNFGSIEFPKPEGGIVVATVPLTFTATSPP